MKTKNKEKRGCLSSDFFLKWDVFGSPMSFNYEENNQTYRSAAGSCVSLIALLFTAVFMTQQAIVLLEYKGTTFTSSLVQNKLASDFTYEGEEFPIAVAMIDVREADLAPK